MGNTATREDVGVQACLRHSLHALPGIPPHDMLQAYAINLLQAQSCLLLPSRSPRHNCPLSRQVSESTLPAKKAQLLRASVSTSPGPGVVFGCNCSAGARTPFVISPRAVSSSPRLQTVLAVAGHVPAKRFTKLPVLPRCDLYTAKYARSTGSSTTDRGASTSHHPLAASCLDWDHGFSMNQGLHLSHCCQQILRKRHILQARGVPGTMSIPATLRRTPSSPNSRARQQSTAHTSQAQAPDRKKRPDRAHAVRLLR